MAGHCTGRDKLISYRPHLVSGKLRAFALPDAGSLPPEQHVRHFGRVPGAEEVASPSERAHVDGRTPQPECVRRTPEEAPVQPDFRKASHGYLCDVLCHEHPRTPGPRLDAEMVVEDQDLARGGRVDQAQARQEDHAHGRVGGGLEEVAVDRVDPVGRQPRESCGSEDQQREQGGHETGRVADAQNDRQASRAM